MAAFRQGIANFAPTLQKSEEDDTVKYNSFRNNATGDLRIAGPGVWENIPTIQHYWMLTGDGVVTAYRDVSPPVFDYYRAIYLRSEQNDEEMKAALAKLSADELARATDPAA